MKMRYPVGAGAMFWRELACFVLGHVWKFPQRAYRHIEGEELAKWERTHRRGGGNPYYTNVASWGVRCRRCRTSEQDSYYPWWKEAWWGFLNFWRTWAICWNDQPWKRGVAGYGYARMPWRVWLVSGLVAGPLFAFEQVWFCTLVFRWEIPSLPGELAANLLHRVWDWIEARTERFDWWPPADPDDPNELGYWMPRNEQNPRERPALRIWSHSSAA